MLSRDPSLCTVVAVWAAFLRRLVVSLLWQFSDRRTHPRKRNMPRNSKPYYSIIPCCVFSLLFSDFSARSPITIPTPPIVALTEFFHADAEINVHPLPVSWHLTFLLWIYLCSCVHIMSMLWSIAEAVSSGSCPILLKVLTLSVAICIVHLNFSYFCFSLKSVDDFLNTGAEAPTSSGRAPFLPARRAMRFGHVVWEWITVIFRRLCFYSHP